MLLSESAKSKQISDTAPSDQRKNSKKRTFPSGAVQFLYDRYVGDDPELIASYEEEVLNAAIARKIFDLRTQAGLSQRALAKLAGTSASAIARLEDADYTGHSLSLLKRVASALDKRLEIHFLP
ncbi:MAG TPA: helix-turn-helix domain-containing protein [Bryobacteraceae bacterium]